MAESFFSTLECELLRRRPFRSRAEARMAEGARGSSMRSMLEWRLEVCFSYIEGFYNSLRLHSGLGYRSPIDYEKDYQHAQAVTADPPNDQVP